MTWKTEVRGEVSTIIQNLSSPPHLVIFLPARLTVDNMPKSFSDEERRLKICRVA